MAEAATGTSGYLIEVTGHADSTGHDAINTKLLSEERAKAVIAYLVQKGGVPVRRVVAPGAMGEYGPVASNETAAGRAENRRVEINRPRIEGRGGAIRYEPSLNRGLECLPSGPLGVRKIHGPVIRPASIIEVRADSLIRSLHKNLLSSDSAHPLGQVPCRIPS